MKDRRPVDGKCNDNCPTFYVLKTVNDCGSVSEGDPCPYAGKPGAVDKKCNQDCIHFRLVDLNTCGDDGCMKNFDDSCPYAEQPQPAPEPAATDYRELVVEFERVMREMVKQCVWCKGTQRVDTELGRIECPMCQDGHELLIKAEEALNQ